MSESEVMAARMVMVAATQEWVRLVIAEGQTGDAPTEELAAVRAAVGAREILSDVAEYVEVLVDGAVLAARRRPAGGHTWQEIGAAMGISGQRAGRRAERRGLDTARSAEPAPPTVLVPNEARRAVRSAAEPARERRTVPSAAALGLRGLVRRDRDREPLPSPEPPAKTSPGTAAASLEASFRRVDRSESARRRKRRK
jgi:hypothetical protein